MVQEFMQKQQVWIQNPILLSTILSPKEMENLFVKLETLGLVSNNKDLESLLKDISLEVCEEIVSNNLTN